MSIKSIIVTISALLLIVGCDGEESTLENRDSNNSGNANTPKQSYGYYVDSAVIGAEYVCGEVKGLTSSRGRI